jgi:hypothetical protein
MEICHKIYPSASPFIITPYLVDEHNDIKPQFPEVGPCYSLPGTCKIYLDHYRSRKTGPHFDLGVFRCLTHHRQAFTAYPYGFTPYSRTLLTSITPDGKRIHSKNVENGDEALSATKFIAAIDAEKKEPWSRKPKVQFGLSRFEGPVSDESLERRSHLISPSSTLEEGPGRWWSTQWRWLLFLTRLMGVFVQLSDSQREALAFQLDVALSFLREKVAEINLHPGYIIRGKAIVEVLQCMKKSQPKLLFQLLGAGQAVGLWGQPLLWDHKTKRLRSIPFRPPSKGVLSKKE